MSGMIRISYLTALWESDIVAIQWQDLKDGHSRITEPMI